MTNAHHYTSVVHGYTLLGHDYTSLEQTYTLLEISAPVSRIKLHIPKKNKNRTIIYTECMNHRVHYYLKETDYKFL